MAHVGRLLGWGVLACCVPFAAAWLLRRDRSPYAVLLAALVPMALLPAYPVLVGALFARWWWLSGAAAGLVVVHLRYAWPAMAGAMDVPSGARAGPRLTVLTLNGYAGRADPDAVAELIALERPDIVAIQELTPTLQDRLRRSGALTSLPYAVTAPSTDPMQGAGLWSKRVLLSTGVVHGSGTRAPSALLRLEDRHVRIHVAHPVAPVTSIRQWRHGLGQLAGVTQRTGVPLVMLGDFNATRAHAPFRSLLDTGLRDAYDARGRLLARTWPAGRRFPPPVLALDHVLVKGLVVLEAHIGPDVGSDHLPVIATVALDHGR